MKTESALSILGLGTWLPPTRAVRDTARANGGDDAEYRSWENACQGGPDDHPAAMGTRALNRALEQAGVKAADLAMLLFTGVSRDYVASWSVSADIMKQCGATSDCFGMDMTAGCVATLAGLEFARTWLAGRGGGYAAIIAAERWTQSIDYRDPASRAIWPYGDSAGAIVVGSGRQKGIASYLGTEFRSASEGNGTVLIPYGGTREPIAPPGANPLARRMTGSRPPKEITKTYRDCYGGSFATLKRRIALQPACLVCNQISPGVVAMIAAEFGLQSETVVTGQEYGHLGGVDMIVGLQRELASDKPRFPILVGASTAYQFGTGLVGAPS